MSDKQQPDAWERISRNHIDDLISKSSDCPHAVCAFEAVRDFNVRMLILPPIADPIDAAALMDAKPFIALIADDGDPAYGPERFHQESLRKLIGLTDCAVVTSTAPNLNIYRLMSLMPSYLRTGSLIIETRPSHDLAWARFLQSVKPELPIILSVPHHEKEQKERACRN